jgi:hypothetical protein
MGVGVLHIKLYYTAKNRKIARATIAKNPLSRKIHVKNAFVSIN